MRTAPVLAALALATLPLPLAEAGHTIMTCMSVWDPQPPPGWSIFCGANDWVQHNPFTPLANCLLAPLEIHVVGVTYDVAEALACV